MSGSICPECRNGKHVNCTGWALDDRDEMVTCGCPTCRETPVTLTVQAGTEPVSALGIVEALDDARHKCSCRGGPHGGYICEGCR